MVQTAARVGLREITNGTPADTGKARSNYKVTLNAPARGVREPFARGRRLGINETQNAPITIALGNAVILGFRPGRDRSIVITNNVPYILKLNNEGWSKEQAPQGRFAEDAIRIAAATATRVRLLGR